jgi:hypothetical protein
VLTRSGAWPASRYPWIDERDDQKNDEEWQKGQADVLPEVRAEDSSAHLLGGLAITERAGKYGTG